MTEWHQKKERGEVYVIMSAMLTQHVLSEIYNEYFDACNLIWLRKKEGKKG